MCFFLFYPAFQEQLPLNYLHSSSFSTYNFTKGPHSVNKNLVSQPAQNSVLSLYYLTFFFFTPPGFYLLPFSLSFPFWKKGMKFCFGFISCTVLVKMPSWSMTVVSKCYSNKAFQCFELCLGNSSSEQV